MGTLATWAHLGGIVKAAPILTLLVSGCTIDVPVGLDPYTPRWSGAVLDGDGDGLTKDLDCNDEDSEIGAVVEICDLIDNDCDGENNEGDVCDVFETFHQSGSLDLLFVLEPGDTAHLAQQRLITALPQLIAPLVGDGRSVRFGVVSMDVDSPDVTYFQSANDDPDEVLLWLENSMQLPPSEGELGARQITRRTLWDNRQWNEFDRDGVELAIVYLSTTEDHSLPRLESVIAMLDELEGPGRWSAHAIVQTSPSDCWGKSAKEDQGVSFMELAEHSNGLMLDHCSPSYAPYTSELGLDLSSSSLRDSFLLGQLPEPGTVEVRVEDPDGGQLILSPSAFSIDGNQVRFDVPPPAGTVITISYTAQPH